MRTITDTMYFGHYKFDVELDTGSETGANQLTVWVAENLDRQCFDLNMLQVQSRVFGEEFFLRDFYFEEANDPHIRNFCRKFALDEVYRQQVLAGETRWARRNALFVRNLLTVVGEDTLLSSERDYDRGAREFFRWVDRYVEEILALPAYQRLKEEDCVFQPSAGELDPLIRPAVEALNRIPGVTTQFSCQGVSGKVRFQGRELLAVSPHEEYAYVSFSELGQSANDAIRALLPSFPSTTIVHIPGNFVLRSVLRSTGDNLRFRAELVELAEQVLASVGDDWSSRPAEEILRELGVDIASVCPYKLVDKGAYVSQLASRYPYRESEEVDDDEKED